MINGKTRAGLLGVAGLYMLYISWELFQSRNETDTTMTPTARWLFIILFVAASVFVLVYAWRAWKQSRQEEENPQPDDDENNLK